MGNAILLRGKLPSVLSLSLSGTEGEGSVLTAIPNPLTATGTYQWYRSDTGNLYSEIEGATSNTYTLTSTDVTKFIKCIFRPNAPFLNVPIEVKSSDRIYGWFSRVGSLDLYNSGWQTLTFDNDIRNLTFSTDEAYSKIKYSLVATAPNTGTDIKIGINLDNELTVSKRRASTSGTQTDTSVTFTGSDFNNPGTGTGNFIDRTVQGKVLSVSVTNNSYGGSGTWNNRKLRLVGWDEWTNNACSISGDLIVGETIIANIDYSGATCTYQWYTCNLSGNNAVKISGATSNTYTLTNNEHGKYVKCVNSITNPFIETITVISTGKILNWVFKNQTLSGSTVDSGYVNASSGSYEQTDSNTANASGTAGSNIKIKSLKLTCYGKVNAGGWNASGYIYLNGTKVVENGGFIGANGGTSASEKSGTLTYTVPDVSLTAGQTYKGRTAGAYGSGISGFKVRAVIEVSSYYILTDETE